MMKMMDSCLIAYSRCFFVDCSLQTDQFGTCLPVLRPRIREIGVADKMYGPSKDSRKKTSTKNENPLMDEGLKKESILQNA